MTYFDWNRLPRPIIGLAPMDGYSDSAFRRVCRAVNSDIVIVTEFTSADGLSHGAESLKRKLWFDPSERPVIAQIFGKNIDTFVRAAKVCEDMGFAGIDINMGCPAKKVVKSEHGVALRKKPEFAFKLIEALASATTLPVSVKTRLGWSDAEGLTEFGIGAQNAGAKLICIHARTYLEPYNVPAQFQAVYEMKRHLTIPVLGNGGITSISDGIQKLGNLDGFLIGQAAFGNPWVFDPSGQIPTFESKIPLMIRHAEWLVEHKGLSLAMREIRKHLVQYVKGIPNAKRFRSQLVRVESVSEIQTILDQILKS